MAGAAAAPGAALAQQRPKKIPRIGIIDDGAIWTPFRDALREAGYIDGQTIAFETRAADGDPGRLAAAAAELAQLPVDLIATYGTPASRAAKAATSTIPIVMIAVGDPVRAGLVQSLARPGGNVTGNTILSPELAPKRLQLIKEIIPTGNAGRVALESRQRFQWGDPRAAPRRGARAGTSRSPPSRRAPANDLDGAFATLARERPDVVLVTSDAVHHEPHSENHRLPVSAAACPGCSRAGTMSRPAA